MSEMNRWRWEKSVEQRSPTGKDFGELAAELCENALTDAKAQVHPLLRSVELERLSQRNDFLQAFKNALEKRIARKLAGRQPGVEAIFKFDQIRSETIESWDGFIHLLVKVPRLSNTITLLGKSLDKGLVKCLKQLGRSRFSSCQSILDVQQVTPYEIRRGISYGAMFYAVYSAPVKVWPSKG